MPRGRKLGTSKPIQTEHQYLADHLEDPCHVVINRVPTKGNGGGYIQMAVDRSADRTKRQYLHRYTYEQNFGPIPEGQVVRHICDVRNCINPNHLMLGTIKENIQDMYDRDRKSKNHAKRLTQQQIDQIIELKLKWTTNDDICDIVGVSYGTVVRLTKHLNINCKEVRKHTLKEAGISYQPKLNKTNPYIVIIYWEGKGHHLGQFPTLEQAIEGRDKDPRWIAKQNDRLQKRKGL